MPKIDEFAFVAQSCFATDGPTSKEQARASRAYTYLIAYIYKPSIEIFEQKLRIMEHFSLLCAKIFTNLKYHRQNILSMSRYIFNYYYKAFHLKDMLCKNQSI